MIIIVILLLVLALGGYRWGGPDNGPYLGGGIGLVLIIILVLYLLGVLGPVHTGRL